MRISEWMSYVCASDLQRLLVVKQEPDIGGHIYVQGIRIDQFDHGYGIFAELSDCKAAATGGDFLLVQGSKTVVSWQRRVNYRMGRADVLAGAMHHQHGRATCRDRVS